MVTSKEKFPNTTYVYSINDKVYRTKTKLNYFNALNEIEWSPINFQWIPIIKLHQELNHISTNEN